MSDSARSGAQDEPTVVGPDASVELARHLADIATFMLAPGVASPSQRIVALAVATVESCDDAALCGDGAESTVMVELEAIQRRVGQGPCVDAVAGADTLYVPDLLSGHVWPQFAAEAVRLGFRSVLVYALSLKGEQVGALQLYSHLPAAFSASERAQGLIFSRYAALALALSSAQEVDEGRIENLEEALLSREVIGQAQGILMERERITADQAFQLLRRSSQHLNRKLRTVAQDIVDTGAIPPGSTRTGR